jgi:K+-sensing histidine kinase KdpD
MGLRSVSPARAGSLHPVHWEHSVQIFWSLILMRADNKGEGGIMALIALVLIFDMCQFVSRGGRGGRGRTGTGLGRSNCRGIIGTHGGEMEALPATGRGTTIRITPPLPPAPESSS